MNANYPRAGGPDVVAVKSDGTKATFTPGSGNTLAVATYYIPVVESRESLAFVHFKWDTTFIGVITFESCGFPEFATPTADTVDIALTDVNTGASLGNWVIENPSSGSVAFASAVGASASALTITVTGGTANGCTVHLGNNGGQRMRAKVACSTGGVLRCATWGKVT